MVEPDLGEEEVRDAMKAENLLDGIPAGLSEELADLVLPPRATVILMLGETGSLYRATETLLNGYHPSSARPWIPSRTTGSSLRSPTTAIERV